MDIESFNSRLVYIFNVQYSHFASTCRQSMEVSPISLNWLILASDLSRSCAVLMVQMDEIQLDEQFQGHLMAVSLCSPFAFVPHGSLLSTTRAASNGIKQPEMLPLYFTLKRLCPNVFECLLGLLSQVVLIVEQIMNQWHGCPGALLSAHPHLPSREIRSCLEGCGQEMECTVDPLCLVPDSNASPSTLLIHQ